MQLQVDAARAEAAVRVGDLRGDVAGEEPARPAVARPLILAIESSCDETAAAIVDGEGNLCLLYTSRCV